MMLHSRPSKPLLLWLAVLWLACAGCSGPGGEPDGNAPDHSSTERPETKLGPVILPALFGDHMVLQQGQAVPIWGWSTPGARVTVQLADQAWQAQAGQDGRWEVRLPALPAGGPLILVVHSQNRITLRNVTVGEVWLCSGQSNMEWPLKLSRNAKAEIRAATYADLRLFTVKKRVAEQPQRDVKGYWVRTTPTTAANFSAVCYFFGRELYRELRVPVGLIHSSWKGTFAESWMSRTVLQSDPILRPTLERWQALVKRYDSEQLQRNHARHLAQWQKAVKQARAAHQKPPPPARPRPPRRHRKYPGNLYNAMLYPLAPYALRGVVWYQGESNVAVAFQYRTMFPRLIENWRDLWKQGDFPFYFVQIAPFRYYLSGIDPRAVAELREAQLLTLAASPNTGMVVTMDISDPADIHSPDKRQVGQRLALWALAKTYGRRDLAYSGPLYKSMTISGNTVILSFDHVSSGLRSSDGQPLNHFTIAGADRKFYPATAVIQGDTVAVSSPQVPIPVAVRFGWGDDLVTNLANGDGLPASPFRTDDWPGVTTHNR